jgi:SAM-dependent methyltransferase
VPHNSALPLSSLTNVSAYQDDEWLRLHTELETYSFDKHVFLPNVYRKGWEWTQTIYGLERLGMVRPEHRAIGVGAGRECVIYWLGDRLARVLATDLYGNDEWSSSGGREASAEVLESPQQFCPRPMRVETVEFQVMDGTALSVADGDFDIAWSLSSIEHFGGHEAAAAAVRELGRVVRPGGVVAVATEYLLLEEYEHPEYFNRDDIETYVLNASADLELVEPIDWSFPPADYLIDSIVLPTGVHRQRRHVVLNDGYVQWTSALFFLRKR